MNKNEIDMKFKGTKGEWDFNLTEHHAVNGFSQPVVDVFSRTGAGLLDAEWVCKVRGENEEVRTSNAKLIASAPDILGCLERLLEITSELNINKSEHFKMVEEQSIAAIKRATE